MNPQFEHMIFWALVASYAFEKEYTFVLLGSMLLALVDAAQVWSMIP